jgi:hypothetical protein
MLLLPPAVARPLLKSVAHIMTTVDHSSSILLNLNEQVVQYGLDHDVPDVAEVSLETVQLFDHIGTAIIAFALWLASDLKQ